MERRSGAAREPQSLEAWDSWVDRLINEAQERGEFDDLPGRGKPLRIDDAPFADGREIGFGILKNAGIAPMWVELDKEIRATAARMEALIARAGEIAQERPAAPAPEPNSEPVSLRWWWPFGRNRERPRVDPVPTIDLRTREITQLRREYLELAEERTKLIGQFNAAIPRELWQLERPKPTVEEAVAAFEAAVG